ncbi:hypothetical protein II906_09885 [bacterium]|nr:hypothetical protein [bacterium]
MGSLNSFLRAVSSTHDIGFTKQNIIFKSAKEQAENLGIDGRSLMALGSNIFTEGNNSEKKNYSIGKSGIIEDFKYDTDYLKTINRQLTQAIEKETGNKFEVDGNIVEEWLASDNECTDGVDDGKISFWSKVGNFFEGVGKTIVGTLHNIVSDPKKLIGTVAGGLALAAISCIPGVGPFIAGAIGIAGGAGLIATSVKTVAENAKKAANATTDAEAKDAWEGLGEGATEGACGVIAIVTSAKGISSAATKGGVPSIVKNGGGWKEILKGLFNGGKEEAAGNLEIFSSLINILKEAGRAIIDPGNVEPVN